MLLALVLALVVLTCLLVAVVAVGAVTALASLSAPLSVFLANVVPYVAGAAILGVLELVVVVALAWTLVKRVDIDVRGGRLESLADHAERHSDLARKVGLASLVERPPERKREDALDALKRRYADGKIDEREFERRLGRLLDNDDVDAARARRERERIRG